MKQVKMKAKFASTCHECKQAISENEDIYYLPDLKKAKHLKCQPATQAVRKQPAPPPQKKPKTGTKFQQLSGMAMGQYMDYWNSQINLLKEYDLLGWSEDELLEMFKEAKAIAKQGNPPF